MIIDKFYEEQIKLYKNGGMPELDDLELILSQHPGSLAIDVGANIGELSYYFLRYGHVKSVEAFEPNPTVSSKLVQLSHLGIRSHQIALSDKPGDGTLITPKIPNSDKLNTGLSTLHQHWIDTMHSKFPEAVSSEVITYPVKLKTLDSYRFNNVKLIKIDVEGHELLVIKGAIETIKKHKPVLIIEAYENFDVFTFIMEYNYKCFFYHKKAEQLRQARTIEDFPNSIYNLIFVPE